MGEEKPYNLATLEVITPIHREAVCTGQRILDTKSQKLDVKKINK